MTALLIALVVGLIAAPVAELAEKLPAIGDKLHTFDRRSAFWRRIQASLGIDAGAAPPSPCPSRASAGCRRPSASSRPPVTGFLYFLVVLLLFISWWPDLRRQLVMTFAAANSRLRVLKILNEVEDSLGGLSGHRRLHQPRGRRRRGIDRRW